MIITILCETPLCPNKADIIIVAGCPNLHINDTLQCHPHTIMHPMTCPQCGQPTQQKTASMNGIKTSQLIKLTQRPTQKNKTQKPPPNPKP